jgi:hypothetical protein
MWYVFFDEVESREGRDKEAKDDGVRDFPLLVASKHSHVVTSIEECIENEP